MIILVIQHIDICRVVLDESGCGRDPRHTLLSVLSVVANNGYAFDVVRFFTHAGPSFLQ